MNEYIDINKPEYTDLSIYSCGMEDCAPGHSWGPGVRDRFLIHYVLKGRGYFRVGNVTYNLSEGNGFLICPNIPVYYEADSGEPWSYCWVGFNGLKAEIYLKAASLTADQPVFMYEKDEFIKEHIARMIDTDKLSMNKEIKLVGLLYLFMFRLIDILGKDRKSVKEGNRKEFYIRKAIEFIRMNYSRDVSIAGISRYVGINRKYLCAVFKERLNISPQRFLIDFRMNKACELMKYDTLSIGEISYSVGYENPLIFSKVFKRFKGLPPREYRKTCIS